VAEQETQWVITALFFEKTTFDSVATLSAISESFRLIAMPMIASAISRTPSLSLMIRVKDRSIMMRSSGK